MDNLTIIYNDKMVHVLDDLELSFEEVKTLLIVLAKAQKAIDAYYAESEEN